MANLPQYQDLHCPGLSPAAFHPPCAINYADGNRDTEVHCWLGGLPDLDQTKAEVRRVQQAHLQQLLDLGIDGFRFDAAKHMPAALIQGDYIRYINAASQGRDWNYLEVITDHDTPPQDYTLVAAITDFVLYHTMKIAFSFGGNLRTLRGPQAVDDPRSVTFGRDHDQVPDWTSTPLDPYADGLVPGDRLRAGPAGRHAPGAQPG